MIEIRMEGVFKIVEGLPTFEEFISTYKSFYEGWQPINPLRQ